MIALLLPLTTSAFAGDDPDVAFDGAGDAVIRRTDAHNDGPINPNSILPDLVQVSVGGWDTPTPTNNPYQGSWTDIRDTQIIKIDAQFNGLVNPPGPLNLQGEGYEPYRYGENPVYGFIEFNLDRERDTGGEIQNIWNRPLGVASRFGGRLSDSIGERAALTGWDFDGDVIRTGEEMHLSLCGCHPFTVNPLNDPTPNTFDAGDTWVITGRLLHRSHAFQEYSFAFGGSEAGEYDPQVSLKFTHNTNTDQTNITLIYAKTMQGAAQLTGQSKQSLDLNAGNHTSIQEMLNEIRFAALNSNGPPGSAYDLLRDWADSDHEDLEDFYDRSDWRVLTLFGTTYAEEQTDAFYVWTDIGPGYTVGDCNGDTLINAADQSVIMQAIAQSDNSPFDADTLKNGQTLIVDFGSNFALYDLNYDGFINALDLQLIGYAKRGDVNNDGTVDQTDLKALRTMLGFNSADPRYNPSADLDGNNIIDRRDNRTLTMLINFNSGGGTNDQQQSSLQPLSAERIPSK